jgi:RNA polymerase sigma-70 factor (ECF subfamily)
MSDTTYRLQGCLDRWHAGDPSARRELLDVACDRLARLTRKMFDATDRLRAWAESTDVFQNAMLRLCRALDAVVPGTLVEFFRLAALQVRRELVDLARRHYGPNGCAVHQVNETPCEGGTTLEFDLPDMRDEPSRLAVWGEFHELIGALPDEQREVFDLVWYQGLTHGEAAALLNVSTKTVQRRWHAACLALHKALQGNLPGL